MERLIINSAISIPLSELRFMTSRSGGPGGQNVNKLETRVELLFDVARTTALTTDQKEVLRMNLSSRVDADGVFHVVAQESRSQWQNKQRAIEKLTLLFRRALKPKKRRIKTQPSRQSKEARIRKKRRVSEKKKLRKVGMLSE